MPRDIDPDLIDHFAQEVQTVSSLVLIVRRDGSRLAFTTADKEIEFDGDVYLASDGMSATEIQLVAGTGIDNLEVEGMVSDGRITEPDLEAGLYDNARIWIRTVNRHGLAAGAVKELAGFLGKVSLISGKFTAEFRAVSSLLRQTRGDRTSATCTCSRLGDARCKVDMEGSSGGYDLTAVRTVATAPDDENLTFADSAPSGFYKHGIVRIDEGPNAGIERVVKRHVNAGGAAEIELRSPFPFPITSGQDLTITAGCDRTIATCRAKFANANNFHGQPHLPGNDKIIRVGRASE